MDHIHDLQMSFTTQISKENLFKKALCERAAANAT